MRSFILQSTAAQVAAHLREEIRSGRLRDALPGYRLLAERIGVNHKTMRASLALLEEEGILVPQGSGRSYLIRMEEHHGPVGFRVSILLFEKVDRWVVYHQEILDHLDRAEHSAAFASKTLADLHFDLNRLRRFVSNHPADAWVVIAGTRDVLEWFADQPFPVFALAGRSAGLRIAGATIRKSPAIATAVKRLVKLGHRRIVMLVREDRRKPFPGHQEQTFLDTLAAEGIRTGSYNLPDWADTVEDFHRKLESLFDRTPPTALLIDEAPLFFAVQQFLAERGLAAPRDVSMLCLDPNPGFNWCPTSIAHIQWHSRPLVSRVVRWVDNVSRGKSDHRITSIKAELIEGGTLGSAPSPA